MPFLVCGEFLSGFGRFSAVISPVSLNGCSLERLTRFSMFQIKVKYIFSAFPVYKTDVADFEETDWNGLITQS